MDFEFSLPRTLQEGAVLFEKLSVIHTSCISKNELMLAVRAVYELVQHIHPISPDVDHCTDKLLQRITAALCTFASKQNLPIDVTPLIACSVVLLLTHLHPYDADIQFVALFRYFPEGDCLSSLTYEPSQSHDSNSSNRAIVQPRGLLAIFNECSKPSTFILAFIHGLLKVCPHWLSNKPVGNVDSVNIFDLYFILENLCHQMKASYIHQAFSILELWSVKVRVITSTSLGNPTAENSSNVLDSIGHVMDICSLDQTRPGRLFKLLSMYWEAPVKGVSNLCISILSNAIGINNTLQLNCSVEYHLEDSGFPQDTLTIHKEKGELQCAAAMQKNSCPPIPESAEGCDHVAVNPALQTMEWKPPCSVSFALLEAVIQSGLWSSRTSYAVLQALLLEGHLSPEQVLHQGGSALCRGLCSGLRCSHLSPAVSAVYRSLVASLPPDLWRQHFASLFLETLTSQHRCTQHNLLTLWLPITVRQYPDECKVLLTMCPDSPEGWRARMALLRGWRDAAENDTGRESRPNVGGRTRKCVVEFKPVGVGNGVNGVEKSTSSQPVTVVIGKNNEGNDFQSIRENDCQVSSVNDHMVELSVNDNSDEGSEGGIIALALVYLDDIVRAEALAFVCRSHKATQPLTASEADLIMDFFFYNFNIDCPVFRQAVVKSYRHLVMRLSDTVAREIQKCPRLLVSGSLDCSLVGEELLVSSKLIVWFIRFIHLQLSGCGNYQRRSMAVQLYRETLLAFSSDKSKNQSKKKIMRTFSAAIKFIEKVSTMDQWFNQSYINTHNLLSCVSNDCINLIIDVFDKPVRNDKETNKNARSSITTRQPISNLLLANTIPLFLSLLTDEMDDIREESEFILREIDAVVWVQYSNLYESTNHCDSTSLSFNENSRNNHSNGWPPDRFMHACTADLPANTPDEFLSLTNQNLLTKTATAVEGAGCFSPSTASRPSQTGGHTSPLLTSSHHVALDTVKSQSTPRLDLTRDDTAQPEPQQSLFRQLLCTGLSRCNSPKASDAESGALLLRVAVSTALRLPRGEEVMAQVVQHVSSGQHTGVLELLLARAELQLRGARLNMLRAAYCEPIYGLLLALDALLQSPAASTLLSGAKSAGGPNLSTPDIAAHVSVGSDESSGMGDATSSDAAALLTRTIALCVQTVEFILKQMALSSDAGIDVAPSFAEISQSIDGIIRECRKGAEGGLDGTAAAPDAAQTFEAALDCGDPTVDEEDVSTCAISTEHQLLLSLCWQTLKACCLLCSSILCSSLHSLELCIVQQALQEVLQRTLVATRHKGAIEAAKLCLARVTAHLLQDGDTRHRELLLQMLRSVLSQSVLPRPQRRSVLRRAAGLAMLVQALCVADYRAAAGRGGVAQQAPTLLHEAMETLLSNARHAAGEQQGGGGEECYCSVALHLLQPLVQQLPQCPRLAEVAETCLAAFTSDCWHCRNAGLQVFGAAATRLVGQKRVAEDASQLNSVTAAQFCARHEQLSQALLRLLMRAAMRSRKDAAERQWKDAAQSRGKDGAGKKGKEPHAQDTGSVVQNSRHQLDGKASDEGCNIVIELSKHADLSDSNVSITRPSEVSADDDSFLASKDMNSSGVSEGYLPEDPTEVELSSAIMPVLCLLSRLSPGIKMEDDNMSLILGNFQEVLQSMLSSCIHHIRSLAAKSLVSLTPSEGHRRLSSLLLDRISGECREHHRHVTTNEFNGCLLAILSLVQRSQECERNTVDNLVVAECMTRVFMAPEHCFVNRALACDVLLALRHFEIKLEDPDPREELFFVPGYASFLEKMVLYKLNASSGEEKNLFLIRCLASECLDVVMVAVEFLEEGHGEEEVDSEVTHLLWNIVLCQPMDQRTVPCLKLLCVRLEKLRKLLKEWYLPFAKIEYFNNLLTILQGECSSCALRNGLILFAYLLDMKDASLSAKSGELFATQVLLYADDNSTEEFRTCACVCISALLSHFLSARHDAIACHPSLKRNIVLLSCNLLTDEDPVIRSEFAVAVSTVLEFRGDGEGHPGLAVHPNKALVLLLQRFGEHCCQTEDIELFRSLLCCCLAMLMDGAATSVEETPHASRNLNLFASETRNLYREPTVLISQVVSCVVAVVNKSSRNFVQKIKALIDEKLSVLNTNRDGRPDTLRPRCSDLRGQNFLNKLKAKLKSGF